MFLLSLKTGKMILALIVNGVYSLVSYAHLTTFTKKLNILGTKMAVEAMNHYRKSRIIANKSKINKTCNKRSLKV